MRVKVGRLYKDNYGNVWRVRSRRSPLFGGGRTYFDCEVIHASGTLIEPTDDYSGFRRPLALHDGLGERFRFDGTYRFDSVLGRRLFFEKEITP